MGGEVVSVAKTLLEVVKSAAYLDLSDRHLGAHSPFSSTVVPSWITRLNDGKGKSIVEVENSHPPITDFLQKEPAELSSEGLRTNGDEQILVQNLLDYLKRPAELSVERFQDSVITHLNLLFHKDLSNISNDRFDELSRILKQIGGQLGPSLVSLLLECSVLLKLWSLVRILLESRVVVSNSCSKLVENLVEEEEPLILCMYASNVPDLTPQDLYLMLTFFLDNVENPSRPFRAVRKEWRRVAGKEILKAGTIRQQLSKQMGSGVYIKFDKLLRQKESVVASAIWSSISVDSFSSPECCIHHLLAAGQDEAVLSSVISRLTTRQALTLMQYLAKWIERHSASRLSSRICRNKRVPTLEQIVSWAGLLLEGYFTTLVLSTDFHKEVRHMRSVIQSLVAVGTSLYPLGGVVEHLRSQASLPVGTKSGVAADSDYVIELLDMS